MKKIQTLIAMVLITSATIAQSWSLTGNVGTTAGTNFIGTTDLQALQFKVNNLQAAYISPSDIKTQTIFGYEACLNLVPNGNSAFGFRALKGTTTGYNNTAIGANSMLVNSIGSNSTAVGHSALKANTTGSYNTAFGGSALLTNTTGGYNAAFGVSALRLNTTGSSNAVFGNFAMFSNTTGYSNVAIGRSAMYKSTVGSNIIAIGDSALYNQITGLAVYDLDNGEFLYFSNNNTAIGSKSLFTNTTGYDNTATGYRTLYNNTSGHYNVANGKSALESNTSGSSNVAVGRESLLDNTVGENNTAVGTGSLANNFNASNNTAFGYSALYENILGKENTALGSSSLSYNSTGSYNTAVGKNALDNNYDEIRNTAIGWSAGSYYRSSSSTFLGCKAAPSVSGISNSSAIGFLAKVTATNQIRLGQSTVTSIGGQVGWTTLSDGRFKKDIKENVPGLSFINKLKPITYHVDVKGIAKYIKENADDESDQKPASVEAINDKAKILFSGFVAQDVEKVAKELNYDFSGVDAPKNKEDYYGLRYAEFVVPLVKAVQELSAQNEMLINRLTKLEAAQNNGNAGSQTVSLNNNVGLGQNIPNPFTNTTIINYKLPQKYTTAQIVITDKSGRQMQVINLTGNGNGKITVDASQLTTGSYQYTLYTDGKMIESKQMICTK